MQLASCLTEETHMKKTSLATLLAAAALVTGCTTTHKPFSTVDTVDSSNWKYNPADMGMTVEEFVNAEGLNIMTRMQNMAGGVNQLYHFTELASADTKWVVSPNNDVIYSVGAVDLSEGFAIHLPEDGDRYVTLQIITQEHTSSSHVGAGVYEYAKGDFNGSHAIVGIRVGTDGTAEDVKHIVENMQPRMRIVANSAEPVPAYDEELLLKTRAHVIQGYNELPNLNGAAVDKVENITDWEKFTYALSGGWGMNFDEISMYSPTVPLNADQNKCYTITFDTPEVDNFWSLTVYNSQNYLMADDYNVVNTGKATLNEDGKSVTVYATNNIADGEKYDNFLLVNEDNWTALVRAYGVKDVKAFADFDAPDWTECE